jgi:translation initiation factor 4G
MSLIVQAQKQAVAMKMRAKSMMDAYFGRIDRLAKGDVLDSRLRFMLLDIIDMRARNWEMRRKAEGPKKVSLLGFGSW